MRPSDNEIQVGAKGARLAKTLFAAALRAFNLGLMFYVVIGIVAFVLLNWLPGNAISLALGVFVIGVLLTIVILTLERIVTLYSRVVTSLFAFVLFVLNLGSIFGIALGAGAFALRGSGNRNAVIIALIFLLIGIAASLSVLSIYRQSRYASPFAASDPFPILFFVFLLSLSTSSTLAAAVLFLVFEKGVPWNQVLDRFTW